MTCPTCDCEVDKVRTGEGKHAGNPVLCIDCRKGTNGHKKMAKPMPKGLKSEALG